MKEVELEHRLLDAAKRRRFFLEKRAIEWGIPTVVTALGAYALKASGIGDPATFVTLGPLALVVARYAGMAFDRLTSGIGEFGGKRIVADIAANEREVALRDLAGQRDRLLAEEEPTVGVPISGTGTALDGQHYPMPISQLEELRTTFREQAEHDCLAALEPRRRRELARARFSVNPVHDRLLEQMQQIRFRYRIPERRARAIIEVFESEVEHRTSQLVAVQVSRLAAYAGRDERIDAAELGFERADDWGSTPEWWKEAGLGEAVRVIFQPEFSLDNPQPDNREVTGQPSLSDL